jgi:hypothetical protein
VGCTGRRRLGGGLAGTRPGQPSPALVAKHTASHDVAAERSTWKPQTLASAFANATRPQALSDSKRRKTKATAPQTRAPKLKKRRGGQTKPTPEDEAADAASSVDAAPPPPPAASAPAAAFASVVATELPPADVGVNPARDAQKAACLEQVAAFEASATDTALDAIPTEHFLGHRRLAHEAVYFGIATPKLEAFGKYSLKQKADSARSAALKLAADKPLAAAGATQTAPRTPKGMKGTTSALSRTPHAADKTAGAHAASDSAAPHRAARTTRRGSCKVPRRERSSSKSPQASAAVAAIPEIAPASVQAGQGGPSQPISSCSRALALLTARPHAEPLTPQHRTTRRLRRSPSHSCCTPASRKEKATKRDRHDKRRRASRSPDRDTVTTAVKESTSLNLEVRECETRPTTLETQLAAERSARTGLTTLIRGLFQQIQMATQRATMIGDAATEAHARMQDIDNAATVLRAAMPTRLLGIPRRSSSFAQTAPRYRPRSMPELSTTTRGARVVGTPALTGMVARAESAARQPSLRCPERRPIVHMPVRDTRAFEVSQ